MKNWIPSFNMLNLMRNEGAAGGTDCVFPVCLFFRLRAANATVHHDELCVEATVT